MICADLPAMKFVSHFLVSLWSVVFRIFCDSIRRGTVSKALFMSIVVSTVRGGGDLSLKPLRICCVKFVSRVW